MQHEEIPQNMKKIIFEAYGPPDNLKLVEAPVPVPADGELLIQIHASSINPIDWKLSSGYLQAFFPLPLPHSPGFDLAGVVVKVGSNVKSFKVGDEVYGDAGLKNSALAEYITLKEELVAHKPKNLSFAEAAVLPLVALTSYQCLVNVGGINQAPGKKVLILGGSGGTGYVAIQIAKHFGSYVTTTVSSRNVQFAQKLGADKVINYNTDNWADVLAGQEYDLIYDTVGDKGAWGRAHRVLKEGATFVTIAARKNPEDKEEAISEQKNKFVSYIKKSNGQDLATIAALVEKGAVTSIIDKQFTLDQTSEAYKQSMSGTTIGKVSVKIK